MALHNQYLTPEEMSEIQTICRLLNGLSEELDGLRNVGVSILQDPTGGGKTFPIHDSNGEILGHIGYGDNGFVMYFDDGKE